MTSPELICIQGKHILPYLAELGQLRIQVFREYPYLYDGDTSYEATYLRTYAQCSDSVIILVWVGNHIVGASTAIPLAFETDEVRRPFIEESMDVDRIFYFGESVLLPQYRGKHIYRQLFSMREQAARDYGSDYAAFCAVKRSPDDPRKPENYRSLEPVWQHFGYQNQNHLTAFFTWKEINEPHESAKPLIFWLKCLNQSKD